MNRGIQAGMRAVAVLVLALVITGCQREATPKAGSVSKRGDARLSSLSTAASGKSADRVKGQPGQVLLAAEFAGEAKAAAPVRGQLTRGDSTLSDDGSYVDYHSYSGRRGERLVITLESGDFDTYLIFGVGPRDALQRLASDDDGAGGTNSRIEITLPQDGTYTILANSYETGATGNYTLRVAAPAAGGGTAGTASTIAANGPVSGTLRNGDATLEDGTFYNPWMYQGRAGERIDVSLTSDDFDTYLVVATGTPGNLDWLAEDDDGAGGTNSRIEITLPETGMYTILANSFGVATGDYVLSLQSRAPVDRETTYPGGGNPAERYALLVGIDNYPGTNQDLNSSVADARLMRQTLIDRFGYRAENIVMLLDQEANRTNIIDAFVRHLGQAGAQGTALFYYSGHGTQMDTNLGVGAPLDPETGDRKDEAIYIWGANERSSIILDDELGSLIDRLQTDRVIVILDSCNSGTASRGPGTPKRVTLTPNDVNSALEHLYVPRQFEGDYKALAAGAATGSGSELLDAKGTQRSHVLLAGSEDHALSYTASGWPDKGGVASVFTYYLVTELESLTPQTTFQDLLTRVRQRTTAYTRAQGHQPLQVPQLGGEAVGQRVLAFLRNN